MPESEAQVAAKFEIKKSTDEQFYFNLLATNGQVILTSERYKDRRGAQAGIRSVRTNAAKEARFDTRVGKDGKPYFALKATNGQDIGRSQIYSSAHSMRRGIASVQRNAPDARVEDLSA